MCIKSQSSAANARHCYGTGANGKLDGFNSADYCMKVHVYILEVCQTIGMCEIKIRSKFRYFTHRLEEKQFTECYDYKKC